jgi:hypothetical protein
MVDIAYAHERDTLVRSVSRLCQQSPAEKSGSADEEGHVGLIPLVLSARLAFHPGPDAYCSLVIDFTINQHRPSTTCRFRTLRKSYPPHTLDINHSEDRKTTTYHVG